jgi:PAS domain S-box-containing protein
MSTARLHILLVEEQRTTAHSLSERLAHTLADTARLATCDWDADAVRQFQQAHDPVDVVLLAWTLSPSAGLTLLRALCGEGDLLTCPVILLAEAVPEAALEEFFARGGQAVLSPTEVVAESLVSILQQAMARYRLLHRLHAGPDLAQQRRLEAQRHFLSQLDEQLRRLVDPEAIRWTALQALGEHLGVARALLNEVNPDTLEVTVARPWSREDTVPVTGTFRLTTFVAPALLERSRNGHTVVIYDTANDPHSADRYTTGYAVSGIGALITVPCLWEGRWVALLTVHHAHARAWQADEIALVEAVAVRIWPAIVKARAEQTVRAREEQLRLIIDNLPGLIAYVDANERYGLVNATYEAWFCRPRATIEGHAVREVAGESVYSGRQRYIAAALAGEAITFENTATYPDGVTRAVLAIYIPHRGPTGQVLGFYALVTDITERKAIEAALHKSEERLRLAVEAGGIGIWDIDLQTGVRTWSPQAKAIYGLSADDVFDRERQISLIHPDDRAAVQAAVRDFRDLGLVRKLDLHHRIRRPDGEVRWVAVRGEAIYPEQAQRPVRLVGTIIDITERKLAEEQLQGLNETLEQRVRARTAELARRNQELDQFAYVASHDLKAPLRAIGLLAQWINEDAGAHLPDTSREHLDKLRRRIKRMEQLLDDLLAYSRANRRQHRPDVVNVGVLVQNITDLLSPPPGFVVIPEPGLPTFTTEDIPLETVLRNLIANALKHHHQPAQGRVLVSARAQDDFFCFAIADNGPGIDPEYHERIFQLFQTLQPRDEIEGSGMGLAIVKKLVENRGGAVWVESAAGMGATFYFTWPQQPPG